MPGQKRPPLPRQQEKPSKFVKGLPSPTAVKNAPAVPATPAAISSGNAITTCKLKSNDIIALTRNALGNHAFLGPLFSYLRAEEDEANKRFAVHFVGFERHPDDPNAFRSDTPTKRKTTSTFNPRYHVFLSIVPENKVDKNTAANRERWAANIIKLNNSPKLQNEGRYAAVPLYYKGDVTPAVDTKLPPASDFLTLRDTMEVIRIAYKTTDGEKPSIEDLLEDESILEKYYSPDLIPKVRALYGFRNQQAPAQDEDHPDLGGVFIEPFEFE